MHRTITAVFKNRPAAEIALRDLEVAGVTEDQVGLIVTDATRGKVFRFENHSRTDEGLAAGAVAGGIVGALVAAAAGAGTLAVPGLNLVLVGPVVATLAGLGTGALTGGVIGALIGLGIPEHEAKIYEDELQSGGILLAVDARDGDQAVVVRKTLERADAQNIAV